MAGIFKEQECGNCIPIKLFRERLYRSELTQSDPTSGSFFEKITVCFLALPSSHQKVQGDALDGLVPRHVLFGCSEPSSSQGFGYACPITQR